MSKMGKKIILVIILSITLGGCFGGFPEVKKVGIIEGYVKDILTNQTLGQVTIRVQDVTFVTDNDGYFPLVRDSETQPYIIPKASGDGYSMKKDGYYGETGVSVFSYGQKNLIGYLTPKASDKIYSINGVARDNTGKILEGVTVIVNGVFSGESFKKVTDSNGVFVFDKIPGGNINIYAFKDGYTAYSTGRINLSSNKEVSVEIREDTTIKYGTIKGGISGFNKELCGHSLVVWGQEGSKEYQFTVADTNGKYTLYGIPEGKSQISVKSPGMYQPSPGSENIVAVTAGAITLHDVQMQYIKGE
ncbi:carboxypeptidase-like regulatory domain-containing protein [Haliovirga abyssi]|uniref:Carboxypeptidase regulatory-like domain-containing protein n=1 Tax=Haliovirga abyssi TaxID=2996794 RepID=A0AAU9DRP1_9FUSO|nr:carboxypeptidase-like regulatory domain-containing protein [Haliovirga abyssi]BDU51268.1 hypothetical protein HLVA_18370 [Haliovirga abyssi]